MGKYSSYSRPKPKPRKVGVHPVMRGIGCIMMVVVPILAYGLAVLLVNYAAARGWPIPPDWFGTPTFPQLLWNLQGLRPILQFLSAQNNLVANLVFAFVLTVLIGGIMAMIYGYIYSLFGPPRYGPQDAPPIRIKVKRYKR
ncbi:MAG TPA: hypothetical protein VK900_10595 [Anaerolineales bacterium]|nr:hypothetical protein [Anaerolineales bacterium]